MKFLYKLSFIVLMFLIPLNIAYAGLNLSDGEFKMVGSEPSAEDLINDLLFKNATLDINNKNVLRGSSSASFSALELNGTIYTGTASLTLDGEYDSDEKRFSGTFTTTQEASYVNKGGEDRQVDLFGDFNMTFSGNFTGGVSEDGVLVLDFKGTKSVSGVDKSSNGNEFPIDESRAWNNRAVFTDFGGASSDEAEGEEVESTPDLVISKVVGDIIYSDPDKRAGLLTKSWRFFSGAYQDDPEGWRKWEQPKEGTVLKKGTRIKTNLGMAAFTMKDGTKFILRRGSEIKIFEGGSIRVEKGSGFFVFPKSGESKEVEAFDFKNVVRGTEFSVTVEGEKGEVRLVEGELEIVPPNDQELFVLLAGEKYEFEKDGFYEKSEFNSGEEKTIWDELEASAPDSVTSDVSEPVWIIPLGLIALLFIIFLIVKIIKGKS